MKFKMKKLSAALGVLLALPFQLHALELGNNATTTNPAGTAIGDNASAVTGTSVGESASSKTNGTALGAKSSADGFGTAVGNEATAGIGATAIGNASTSTVNSVSLGANTNSSDASISIGNDATSSTFGVAIGFQSKASEESTAIRGTASGYSATIGGFASNQSTSFGNASYADNNSVALGRGARAEGKFSVAIGSNSSAYDDYTVQFGGIDNTAAPGSEFFTRRLTGISDGIAGNDAVTVSQMYNITSAMGADIFNLTNRVSAIETGGGGTGTGSGVTSAYVDNGDAATLNSANATAAAGDTATLQKANNYADTGDAKTLESANQYSEDGDKKTLRAANEVAFANDRAVMTYADAGDTRTLSAANEYSDIGDARTLASANSYTKELVGDLEDMLSAGIASVAAQPMLPALNAGQKAIAVGTGHYNGANAIGIAGAFSPRQNLTLGVGISGARNAGSPVVRTSASYVW